jgi:hydrogenase maturation protease
MKEMEKIGIIGIGNLAQQDDGIGVWLVEELMKKTWPVEVELVSLGPRVHEIPLYMMGKKILIIVDALNAGCEPGDTFFLNYRELVETINKEQFFQRPFISIHDASFGYWLATGFFAGFCPKVFLIGIRPANVGFGYGLSPHLQSFFPRLVLQLESLIKEICEGKRIARKGGESLVICDG